MNIEQHNFITQYLRHNSAYTAYCIAFNVEDQSQYESIMCAAQQLMDDPEVGGVIRSVLEGVRHDAEQEIREQQKTELLTIQRKRELLANIATGEMYAVQNYKGKDCNQCTQMVRPTINQMLKAIDLDSKLAGHYSVDKRQLTKSENISETQQLSEVVSLQPLKEPSFSQQNATKTVSPAGGGRGMDYSQKTKNPRKRNNIQQLWHPWPWDSLSRSRREGRLTHKRQKTLLQRNKMQQSGEATT